MEVFLISLSLSSNMLQTLSIMYKFMNYGLQAITLTLLDV